VRSFTTFTATAGLVLEPLEPLAQRVRMDVQRARRAHDVAAVVDEPLERVEQLSVPAAVVRGQALQALLVLVADAVG